jgi:hypothetical protein
MSMARRLRAEAAANHPGFAALAQPTKQKTIVLSYFEIKPLGQYEVKSITNSLMYSPGTWLDTKQIAALLAEPDWDVEIDAPGLPIPIPT